MGGSRTALPSVEGSSGAASTGDRDGRETDRRPGEVIPSEERGSLGRRMTGRELAGTVAAMGAATPLAIRGVHRVQEWARSRPATVDVSLAVLVAAISVIDVAASPDPGEQQADLGAFLLVAAGCLALIWRRSAPFTVAAIASAVLCVYWIAGYTSFLAPLGLPALYSLVVHGQDRRRTWTEFLALCAGVVAVASLTVLSTDSGFDWFNAVGVTVYLAGTGAVAAVVRNRQRIFVDTQRRAEQAEADRLAEAERAVAPSGSASPGRCTTWWPTG